MKLPQPETRYCGTNNNERYMRLKKFLYFLSGVSVFAVILLCACYALGVFFGPDAREVKKKEFTVGEYVHTYTGTLLDGMFNGSGEIVFSDGSRYQGGFASGRFHGKGIFFSADGWRYEGLFDEGQITEGVLYGTDGDVLTQNPNGVSDFLSSSDWRYTGNFGESGQTGKGKFVFADGAVYEGGFERGLADGQGSYQSPEGWSYDGNFQQGVFHGEGKLTHENGKTVAGVWMKGIRVLTYD